MVEAPDHGHETTSEAFSFWAWLEVTNGRITGDWSPLDRMFASMEANIIPTAADQPTNSFYNPADPADFAPEADLPSGYPSPISSSVPVGIGSDRRRTADHVRHRRVRHALDPRRRQLLSLREAR